MQVRFWQAHQPIAVACVEALGAQAHEQRGIEPKQAGPRFVRFVFLDTGDEIAPKLLAVAATSGELVMQASWIRGVGCP